MTQTHYVTAVGSMIALLLMTVAAFSVPMFASAATYAYVDATGEVKSVTAADWMLAIATAPNIHIHSGVMLLMTAADFLIVGDDVIVSQ